MQKRMTYTKADLKLGSLATISRDDGITTHSHRIEFGRPLTEAERHLFCDVLRGFYHTVRFSRQFGADLVAEPIVEFTSSSQARYTLRQTSMQGAWKDLLFAILTNFSHEIAPIARHDESRAFAPEVEIVGVETLAT
ncbi:MAG: hypothetical protein KJZ86_07775 [Caldilineaceae bacterium]|nr:hypothetical protein [Caldilineaceae bacterium]